MNRLANTGRFARAVAPASAESRDFLPSACWKNLRLRAELLKRLRGFFEQHGILEVETPILSADTVVDRHLDPLCTTLDSRGAPLAPHAAGDGEAAGPSRRLWLQTSPEFAMKRLLAADGPSIYQVTRSFRAGEQGPLHNPEFTIVEWYRPGDDMARGMELTGELCEAMLDRGPAQRMTYGEAFQRHVGIDPHTADTAALIEAAERHGLHPPASLSPDDRDGWLDLLLVALVQPHLGSPRPVLLYDYPAGQAALARVRPGPPPVAERFELYVAGIELANGYHELLDPDELRRRNRLANSQRRADGKAALPESSRLLAAMQSGLPPMTGVALGFDRLVMLAAGAASLAEVTAFPIDRA